MRYRYYNPEIKRFINQDVLIGSIGNSNSLNRYSYVEGNPISYTDPFGLSPYQWISAAIHTGLDFIGIFIPGADIVNAFYYLFEGNPIEFAKSLIYAIPGSDFVTKGSDFLVKLGKNSDEAVELVMFFDKGAHIAAPMLAAYDYGSGVGMMIDKYLVNETEASVETAAEIVLLCMGGYQTYKYKDIFGKFYGGTMTPNSLSHNAIQSTHPEGVTYEGPLYRNVGTMPDGTPINPLTISDYTNTQNYRYTQNGRNGIYFASSNHVVEGEMGAYGADPYAMDRTTYCYDSVTLNNMLDLTNASTRGELGVTLDDLISSEYKIYTTSDISPAITHSLGRFADDNGYTGLIVPSARADGGVNIVIFDPYKIDFGTYTTIHEKR